MDNFNRESFGIAIAAVLGSFIGTAMKKDQTPFSGFVSVLAGIAASWYFTPAIIAILAIPEFYQNPIAFIIGTVGMILISIFISIMEYLKNNPLFIIEAVKDYFTKRGTTVINNYGNKEDDKE